MSKEKEIKISSVTEEFKNMSSSEKFKSRLNFISFLEKSKIENLKLQAKKNKKDLEDLEN